MLHGWVTLGRDFTPVRGCVAAGAASRCGGGRACGVAAGRRCPARHGETVGITPRVFGALLWEDVTGLPYLTEQSDLDLLRRGPDVPTNLLRAPLANMT